MSEPVHLEEVCPECGTRRRVIESLPKQPLRAKKVQKLQESPQVKASHPVLAVRGSLVGFATEDEITKDIVLAKEEEAQVVRFYEGTGWVLEHTFEPSPNESPEEMAERLVERWTESMVLDMLEATIDELAEEAVPSGGERIDLLSLLSDPDDPTEDYTDTFAPDPNSTQEMECLHCGATFEESEVTYEQRFGDYYWWCPTEGCDGAGVGFDIYPVN
jgi:hypothetical protein